MTCEELWTQYEAQIAAGDHAAAHQTYGQYMAQGCDNQGQGGGTPIPPGGND